MMPAMVWGGATLDAIARLRRDQRQQAHRKLDYRKLTKAARGPLGPAKEPFDCMFLCDHCGYLADTAATCPSCTHMAWIDLDNWAHAEALRQVEESARQRPIAEVRWGVRAMSLAIGATLGCGLTAGLALAGGLALIGAGVIGFGAGATGAATALTHALGRRAFGWRFMARRVRDPARWRLPLPFADPRATVAARVVGPARARGPLLRAPFSGRPCVAYEVAVLFDYPHDAWPPTWVLREVRSCALEVEGREVAADAAMLELPTQAIDRPALDEDGKRRFLRERGLFLADGEFDLFEAVVLPDQTVELQWPSAPVGAPPRVLPAAQALRRGPYRG